MVSQTGYRIEYVIWEMPCAWLLELTEHWPTYEKKDERVATPGEIGFLGGTYEDMRAETEQIQRIR